MIDRTRSIIIICLLSLLLAFSGCSNKNAQELELQQLQQQLQESSEAIAAVTAQRDALQAELDQVQSAQLQAQETIAELEQQIESLSLQIEELTALPPLEPGQTISLFGIAEQLMTDGETEYVPLGRFNSLTGKQVQSDSVREWEGSDYLPLEEAVTSGPFVLGETLDGQRYLAKLVEVGEIAADTNVPVLMYHAVSDQCWGIEELFVSPSEMEKQLKYLSENGYDPIWFSDLDHLQDYDKPVILTFDDGYDDNYLELFPLLEKYNAKATIFVIGNAVGANHKMNAQQIYELAQSGLVSIQSHGYTHKDMDAMDEQTLIYELSESQNTIACITGEVPYVLCYPTGKHSNLTVSVAEQYYTFALKMNGGLYNTDDDPFRVNRYYISRYTDLNTFAAYCG